MSTSSTASGNLVNDSHLPQILTVQTVVLVLALICVCLRLYVRIRMTKSMGRDDWTMAGAALCSVAAWALFVYQGIYGLGHHVQFISLENQSKISQATFWQVIISSCLGMALLKISIALNLLRLSPSRWYVWCLWLAIGFVSAYSFMGAMTFFCFCRPMRAFWDHTIQDAKCYSIHLFITFALINTAFNVFTDVLFASLPIPIIWKLQMKRKVRLYLIGILSLGYVAVAFGVTNAVYQIAYSSNLDSTYDDSILFFAVLQVNTGMMAACIPSLKPLVSKALKLSEYTNSRSHGNYGSRYPNQFSNRSRSIHWHNQYALQELQSNDDGRQSDEVQLKDASTNYSATVTFYKGSSSPSVSEGNHPAGEEIIADDRPPHRGHNNHNNMTGGIIRTTEVILQ